MIGGGYPRRLILIDNLCGWPNLGRLADGSLFAVVYNQPNHGIGEGDADVWGSLDGGLTWNRRGTATRHEPFTNRMNVASGVNRNNEIVVLCGGWDEIRPTRSEKSRPMPFTVSLSGDGGRTWQISNNHLPQSDNPSHLVPFGDICVANNGDLVVGLYSFDVDWDPRTRRPDEKRIGNILTARSPDEGKTWTDVRPIENGNHVEAALIHLGEGKWLSASRRFSTLDLEIHGSDDDAHTWSKVTVLGVPSVSAAHLLKMSDGRILITYGNRSHGSYGIDSRVSEDGGKSWSAPQRLVDLDAADNGYPEAIEMENQRILVAYYVNGIAQHNRYHVGAVNFSIGELIPAKTGNPSVSKR